MPGFHHGRLPGHSTLLAGRRPRDAAGFTSERLQVWYNQTERSWVGGGEVPHAHTHSDECFIVLRGSLVVEVEGQRHTIAAGEYCCFQAGVYHAVVEVHPPVETLMLRAPSVEDKLHAPTPPAPEPSPGVSVEEWTSEHPRWLELQRVIEGEGQTSWVSFSAEWHHSSHLLMALAGGEVAGFLRFVLQPIGPDMDCEPLCRHGEELREAKILAFGVVGAHRRRGLGRLLQAAAVARARELGCYQVRSHSSGGNDANYALKLALGFAAHPVNDHRGPGVYFVMPLR